jgi:hypothetical protein
VDPSGFFCALGGPDESENLDICCQFALGDMTREEGGKTAPTILRWVTDSLAAGRAGVFYVLAYMDDAYRRLLATVVVGAMGRPAPVGVLDLISTSAKYLTDYAAQCVEAIHTLATASPRAPPSKVGPALAAIAAAVPDALFPNGLPWLAFLLSEPPTPDVIQAAVALVCVMPPNEALHEALQAVGSAFSRCIGPVEDVSELQQLVEWIVPVMQASRPTEDRASFVEALFRRVADSVATELWGLPEAQSDLAGMIDAAFAAGWLRDAAGVRQWLLTVVGSCPDPAHALVARHWLDAPIEPIWTFLNGPGKDCRITLDALRFVVERHPELIPACRPDDILAAIHEVPAALPEGARVLASIVASSEFDAGRILAGTLTTIRPPRTCPSISMPITEKWTDDAADAVWTLCEAVAARLGNRESVAELLFAAHPHIIRYLQNPAHRQAFLEQWRATCLGFRKCFRSDDQLRLSFAWIAAIVQPTQTPGLAHDPPKETPRTIGVPIPEDVHDLPEERENWQAEIHAS